MIDEVSRKRTKSGRKDMTERKSKIGEREFTGWPPCLPWGDSAEEAACSSRGVGPRPIHAGWVAMRTNTAARRERAARLGYYPLVSRQKRRYTRYSPARYYQLVSRKKRMNPRQTTKSKRRS